MGEPISIQDFRTEEARHDAEHFPAETQESFANVSRAVVREWRKGTPNGEWQHVTSFPVLCREWLRDSTCEDNTEIGNTAIVYCAITALIIGGDSAADSFTEFLTDWLWRGDSLR